MEFCKLCRSRDAPLYVAAVFGWLMMSLVALFVVVHAAWEDLEHDFGMHVEADIEALRDRLRANEAVLSGFTAFVGAVEAPSRSQLERYGKFILSANPHIYMMEVMQYVPHSARAAFERDLQARLGSEFGIRSFDYTGDRAWSRAPDKSHYYPITFIAPETPEARPVLGLDMDSVPHLRAGVAEASRRGIAISSAPFRMVEGDLAYAMFQKAPYAEAASAAMVAPEIYAMLLIKVASLIPANVDANATHRVSVVTDGGAMTPLFEIAASTQASKLERALLPVIERNTEDFSTSQPVQMDLQRQMVFSDISGTALSAVAALMLISLCWLLSFLWRHNQKARAEDEDYRKASHGALHDVLTGLPNRRLFLDRLQRAIAGWHRSKEGFALFFIDLDHFKEINDRYGHDAGDFVLRATAQRIEGCTRETDTVARIAGDEFVVLLTSMAHPEHVGAVAQEILAAVAYPVQVDAERSVQVTASVGISLCPDDGIDAEVLLNCADRAMYTVKAGGRGAAGFHRTVVVERKRGTVAGTEEADPETAGVIH